ncbi:hypothetical protein [Streptomyces sp. NPDC001635]
MKASHRPAELFAAVDAPDLMAHAGPVPMIGLSALVAEKVKLAGAGNGSRRVGPISCASNGWRFRSAAEAQH